MKLNQLKNFPKEKERCKCYDDGNRPALLTNFHSFSNICASCGKPMSSELKACNSIIKQIGELLIKLNVKKTEYTIFSFLHKKGLSQTYRTQCCVDGCSRCDGTGYMLNDLGVALT
ncbi:MAG: hypothetical protein ABGF52_13540, partial [Candidatus Asgardarchaeum sp.]